MDTTHNKNEDMNKQAQKVLPAALAATLIKGYIPISLTAGTLLGSTMGIGASMLKSKNPDILEMSRKKKFYDAKIREMTNERWLDEVLQLKRRLETEKMTDIERKAVEEKYVKLLNK